MLYGLLNGWLGNLIKDNSAGTLIIYAQNISQVPRYCFTFAVRVGCQINLSGILSRLFKVVNDVALATNIYILRCKVIIHINTELTLRQITQMSHRSLDYEALPQILLDGLSLSRRLYQYQLFVSHAC